MMKSFKILGITTCLVMLVLLVFLLFPSTTAASPVKKPYGVFIGLDSQQMKKLYDYQTVVIDAQYFTKSEIKTLHNHGVTVYSYLNIGSIENFRDYYKDFEDITLGDYENWPEERWIDVSQKKWQTYLVDTIAASLQKKGVDGYFLDNTDVYYVYPKTSIYKGVLSILKKLDHAYGLPLILNGGDTFLKKAIEKEESLHSFLTGVNQECVFSSIDFEHNLLTKQTSENTKYFKDYLLLCKSHGLKVYLTEYTTSSSLTDKINKYSKTNGFAVYISNSINLD